MLATGTLVFIGLNVKARTIFNCNDGQRSMVLTGDEQNMVGYLKDYDLQLDDMSCGTIPQTHTIRCNKGEYFVDIFRVSSTQKWTAQVNLVGDFYPDSGYLHSLDCE